MGKVNSTASSSASVKSSPESRQGVVAELGPLLLGEFSLLPVEVLGIVNVLVLAQSLGVAQNVGLKFGLGDLGGIALQLLELLDAWLYRMAKEFFSSAQVE